MLDVPQDFKGVLPSQWLHKAVAEGAIGAGKYRVPDESVQPASLDLRLGERAHRLRSSFLPESHTVEEKLAEVSMGEIDLRDGAILERNRPYLIPLIEHLDLPPNVRGRANPRSSTGRLDIFTRVITDRSHQFDEISAGYTGRLWLEVVPRSFTIKVQEGISLNQLRLEAGSARRDDSQVLELHARDPILFDESGPLPPGGIAVANGLFLSLDLTSPRVGYRAKKNSRLLDLTQVGGHDVDDFWEPVHAERGNSLILEPEEFYLLISAERVRIPPEFAAEMTAYDPTSGELRTHYAGFFDPGFGHAPEGRQGTRAVLEVRAHDVPFMIENRQRVCKLVFEAMAEPPAILYGAGIGSSYQHQELTLSKHFRPAAL